MTVISTWTALETRERLRAGDVTATEVVAAHLAAAEGGHQLGAITRIDATALDQAAAVDRKRAAGGALGPLAGVPVTIKDNIDVAGQSSPNGLAFLDAVAATADAPTVAHLRSADAIILGRTNTPEFSWRWHTDNPLFGPTVNPRWPHLTPGGSSGGAAAALAAGIGCLAQGNDAGGSVRWPAACCGVTALRPTQGRVPGHSSTATIERPLGIDLMATQGPMARNVEDLQVMLAVLAQPSWRDPAWVPGPVGGSHERRVGILEPARLGDDGPCDPAVVAAVERASAMFLDAGWTVRTVRPPSLVAAARAWARLINTDFAVRSRPVMEREGSAAIAMMLETFDYFGPPLDITELYDVLALRASQLRAWQDLLTNDVDVVLLPVASEPAWPVDDDLTSLERMAEIFTANTPLVMPNFLGLPAAAVPLGEIDARPAAVQLVGRRFADGVVLDAARTVEAARGPA